MNFETALIAFITFIAWGVGSFIAKLATNKIGDRAVFFDIIAYAPTVIIFCLLYYRTKSLLDLNKSGILLALLSGLIGSIGIIGFYLLLSKKDASSSIPLTALYPTLTAVLAFIFLKESLTVSKIVGIILATLAIFFLSK